MMNKAPIPRHDAPTRSRAGATRASIGRVHHAGVLLLALCAGCPNDMSRGPFCWEHAPFETVPVDTRWGGVTPREGLELLQGLTGDWVLRESATENLATVRLRARAQLAGDPRVYRRVDPSGRVSCGSDGWIGVPVHLDLSSPDGSWSFSGEVVYSQVGLIDADPNHPSMRTPSGWGFRRGDGILRIDAFDEELITPELASACSDDVVLKLHGPHYQTRDGSMLLENFMISAWCDDSWFQPVIGGPWTARHVVSAP